MDRATLIRRLTAQHEKHRMHLSEGQQALASYAKEDERKLARVEKMPNYKPGFCIDCGAELSTLRVEKYLAIECVACLTKIEKRLR